MKTAPSNALRAAALVAISLLAACGGSDGGGGTPPVTVASVAITAPAAGVTFQTLGRARTFTAQPKDAAGGNVTATVTWSSSNAAVATVNASSGVVTSVANGTTNISAAAGGQTSPVIAVTVTQLPAAINGLPATVAFGAIGSSRTLTGSVVDSGGAAVAGAAAPVFSRAGSGASATVAAGGLVTATGVGIGDTAVATAGAAVVRAPIVVTQVVNTVVVTSTSPTPDTLYTSTRTRQFTATARDSNNNIIASAVPAWTSSVTGVATAGPATGLVTAGTTDGVTNVQATAGGISGVRPLVVRRYASTLTITPSAAQAINTAGGLVGFTGVAQDSVNANMTINWVARPAGIVNLSAATGTTTNATASGNGLTYVVLSAGTAPKVRSDSTSVTTSNQPTAPPAIAVTVGDNFFRSVRNNTQNAAVDTVAVNGTVTWTWAGTNPHSVQSNGPPAFTSSTTKNSGTYGFTFTVAGTYQYDCAVHGAGMTGRIVVQ